jgi:hypothetical protein
MFQNLALAVCTPLYLFIHLLSSPTAEPLSSKNSIAQLIIPSYDIIVLPLSIALGLIFPSALMMHHGRFWSLGSIQHQQYMALWQVFPLLTVVSQWLLKSLCILIKKATLLNFKGPARESQAASYLRAAQNTYVMILIICISTHAITIFICAVSAWPFIPIGDYLPFDKFEESVTFSSVFLPTTPLPGCTVADLAEGAHIFLQWDIYISATSCLLWGVVLYRNIYSISWYRLALKVLTWSALAGPFGALAILLWERDMITKRKTK